MLLLAKKSQGVRKRKKKIPGVDQGWYCNFMDFWK